VTLIVDEVPHSSGRGPTSSCSASWRSTAQMSSSPRQTLVRALDRLNRTPQRTPGDLRAAVFSNLDGLVCVPTPAPRMLRIWPRELAGRTRPPRDLLELGHYQCYARLTDAPDRGTSYRRSAWQLDPAPPESGRRTGHHPRPSFSSRAVTGRDALDVELDLQSAFEPHPEAQDA